MADNDYESDNVKDNEQRKFRPDSNGDTAVNTIESYAGDGTPGGTNIQHDYQEDLAVPKDTTVSHDFVVNDGEVGELHQVNMDSTDLAEFEVLIGDGEVAEVFTPIDFFDTAIPLIVPYQRPVIIAGTLTGRTIRIEKTNLANQDQDLFSKMILVIT